MDPLEEQISAAGRQARLNRLGRRYQRAGRNIHWLMAGLALSGVGFFFQHIDLFRIGQSWTPVFALPFVACFLALQYQFHVAHELQRRFERMGDKH